MQIGKVNFKKTDFTYCMSLNLTILRFSVVDVLNCNFNTKCTHQLHQTLGNT